MADHGLFEGVIILGNAPLCVLTSVPVFPYESILIPVPYDREQKAKGFPLHHNLGNGFRLVRKAPV